MLVDTNIRLHLYSASGFPDYFPYFMKPRGKYNKTALNKVQKRAIFQNGFMQEKKYAIIRRGPWHIKLANK